MTIKDIFVDKYGDLRDVWLITEIAGVMLGVLYVVVALVGLAVLSSERVRIEQVRTDVAQVGCVAAEDAIGIAIKTNRGLVDFQYWAHHRLLGLAVPNGWDDIATIDIPDCN